MERERYSRHGELGLEEAAAVSGKDCCLLWASRLRHGRKPGSAGLSDGQWAALETALAVCCAREWLAFPAAHSKKTCFPLWKVSSTILSLSWDNRGLRNAVFPL